MHADLFIDWSFIFLFFWHILYIHCLNIYKLCIFDFITRRNKYHSVVKPVKWSYKGSIVILNDRYEHLMTWIWLAFDDIWFICRYAV